MKKDDKSILFIFLPLKHQLGRSSTEIITINENLAYSDDYVQNEVARICENLREIRNKIIDFFGVKSQNFPLGFK